MVNLSRSKVNLIEGRRPRTFCLSQRPSVVADLLTSMMLSQKASPWPHRYERSNGTHFRRSSLPSLYVSVPSLRGFPDGIPVLNHLLFSVGTVNLRLKRVIFRKKRPNKSYKSPIQRYTKCNFPTVVKLSTFFQCKQIIPIHCSPPKQSDHF